MIDASNEFKTNLVRTYTEQSKALTKNLPTQRGRQDLPLRRPQLIRSLTSF